ncbi:hypothetical protein BS47DRAFT_1483786 [Hydnum rufescens UP504]|uniref:Uncharacterized protein n=1 Tax=Hydnum rufescens UP504 TaxID=1448309 RepID=A0A9P6B3D1_9AGAM|nr:hypothetical protein BS47DRAFT_1483786 [Hydnum rufescens UP504]
MANPLVLDPGRSMWLYRVTVPNLLPRPLIARRIWAEEYIPHYLGTITLNQLAIGSPCVFPTSPTYPYCTQARVPGATSTPHSLMSDLGRHLRGLAVTPPRKKRVRFTVQRQRIIEGGGVRKPRLPTILLMWTKNTDASQPASWKNLSRCPRPGIFSSPAAGASPSFPLILFPDPGAGTPIQQRIQSMHNRHIPRAILRPGYS